MGKKSNSDDTENDRKERRRAWRVRTVWASVLFGLGCACMVWIIEPNVGVGKLLAVATGWCICALICGLAARPRG